MPRALFIKIRPPAGHPFDRGARVAQQLRALADRLENFGLADDTFCNVRDGSGNNTGHAGMDEENPAAGLPSAYR